MHPNIILPNFLISFTLFCILTIYSSLILSLLLRLPLLVSSPFLLVDATPLWNSLLLALLRFIIMLLLYIIDIIIRGYSIIS